MCHSLIRHVRMIRMNALLLLMLFFVASSSTKSLASSTTATIGDASVAHAERLTQTGNISTVAGSQGYAGHYKMFGIAATTAKLDYTESVAIDATGDLLISTSDHMILKVTASTGLITKVAGTGESGFSGDGALATTAKFYHPSGIALDKYGNIFVVDKFNHRIRKITLSTGIITTVAGAGVGNNITAVDDVPAVSATLSYPTDVDIDALGNIYITDTGNGRVRKVTASTGIITSIAGNGRRRDGLISPVLGVAATTSSFISPMGVTVDLSGNVFFTDFDCHSIYKVTARTGFLTLVAGKNGDNSGYNGDNISARKAMLNRPTFITIDALGSIYFSDAGNDRVRKITARTGMITTMAGQSATLDTSCRYHEHDGDGGIATSATLCYIRGLAVDATGNIYICDSRLVRKVTRYEELSSSVVTPISTVSAEESPSIERQSSSARHIAGACHVTVILLITLLISHLF